MATKAYKGWSVVASSTTAFTVCFMVWMMFAVIGIPIKQNLGLNETQFGILIALPVLTGSLIRLPLGMWTDRFGGRIVFFILMLSTVFPIWFISRATEFWHFLVTGFKQNFIDITVFRSARRDTIPHYVRVRIKYIIFIVRSCIMASRLCTIGLKDW